ncbi:hypothetical protein ACEZCY_21175 [Streptacidiphilus sp. N1-12]|uniref:Exonuclease III n=2 Tax=Streptacidiphilus alkalitolerans TaxID=3342712 RepID=A0ABV6VDK1_9ACTN
MRRITAVLLALLAAVLVGGAVSAGASADVNGSTITLTSTAHPLEGDQLTFHFVTAAPGAKNWVGIYDGSRQPGNGASLVWKYTPGSSGDVTLDTSGLTGGPYSAYLLANDGYSILATSAPFSFAPRPAPVLPHFAVADFSARALTPGAPARIALGGLWIRPSGSTGGAPSFSRVSGDSWLDVAADGTVTGTAPADVPAHPALLTVQATDSAGHSAQLTVEVPVLAATEHPTLKTASLNLWDAGTHVDDPLEKQIAVVLGDDLDVVALQETGGSAAQKLADALGWYAYQSPGDLGVVSRLPLTDAQPPTAALPAAAVTVHLDATRTVRVWTAHLDEAGYPPYAVCVDGASGAQALAAEQSSTRAAQATALAAAMRADLARAGQVPVVLAADLASPSDLDWTAKTSAAHCGAGAVKWPVTSTLAKAGLQDAYRVVDHDPAKSPGATWSPVLTLHPGSTTTAEPQDRIDYVDFAGGLTPVQVQSLVTGWPKTEPDTAGNGWPSDHAAAVALFSVN